MVRKEDGRSCRVVDVMYAKVLATSRKAKLSSKLMAKLFRGQHGFFGQSDQ